MEKGFHSLVVLLARHATQEEKNAAVLDALSHRKTFVSLLLEHGA